MNRSSKLSWLFFFREFPLHSASMVVFLVLAGAAESVGAVSIVPLLGEMVGGGLSDNVLLSKVNDLFSMAGVTPSLVNMLIVICLAMVGKAVLTMLAFQQTGYIEAEIVTRMRLQLLDGLLRARWAFSVSQPAGSMTYALSTEATYAGMALRSFSQLLSYLIQAVVYLAVGAFVSWQVLVAGFGFGALFFLGFRGLIRMVRRAGNRQVEALNTMTSVFTDALIGAKPLKVMNADSTFVEYIKLQAEHFKKAARQNVLGVGLLTSLHEPCMTILLAGGLYLGAVRLGLDVTSILAMAFFFQRILTRVSSSQQMMQQYAALEGTLNSMVSKIRNIAANSEIDVMHIIDGDKRLLDKEIVLRGVGVQYDRQQVLGDFNLVVRVGALTALTGPSGSGKTTVADVVTGLIRPDEGEVLVDGVPMAMLDMAYWRDQIGYVPQEVFLFHDTIRKNITMGRNISDDDIWNALEQAGASSFIRSKEEGLDWIVGEQGRALSGGQRQRLMIARALVRKPRLLILDEATTGLDEPTERSILESLVRMKGGMAILAISHQPAVQQVADVICSFNENRRGQ